MIRTTRRQSKQLPGATALGSVIIAALFGSAAADKLRLPEIKKLVLYRN